MKQPNLSSESIPVEDNATRSASGMDDDGGFSDPYNIPDDFWEGGVWEEPSPKEAISIRVDHFVLDYFKRPGPGYQARINAVLRSYVLHQMLREAEEKGRAAAQRAPDSQLETV